MLLGSGPNSVISRLVIPPARNRARLDASRPLIAARRVLAASGPCQARIEHAVQDVFARLRDLQRLGQQITVVVDHYVPRAQSLGERVVLGLRPAHPEHVVEEQVGGVVGRQPLELQVRTVQYHLPQAADLGIHVEHDTPASEGSCPSVISWQASAGP